MSAELKFVKHSSFPQANVFNLASGWFWKMTVREWAIAKLEVSDTTVMPVSYTGGTNNPGVVRILSSTRSPDGKTMTLKFYAHSQGQAFLHLRDTTGSDPFGAVDGKLMQLEVQTRRSATEATKSLTKLEGTTFATNAPDTICYSMGTTQTFQDADPLKLFDKVPAKANHVVVASHGIMVGTENCMFVGGADYPDKRIQMSNVEAVFAKLKGKVDEKCVVWLGGCGIGSNNDFCSKASRASGCPVFASGHVLQNKSCKSGYVDILDRVGIPKCFLPTPDASGQYPPRLVADLCMEQEARKFVVPI